LWRKRQRGSSSSGLLTKAALDYRRLGWSVIPIAPRGKQPLVRWQVYQHRQPHAPEVSDWFRQWPDANLAIVTGVVSGLVVLDVDPRHGGDASLRELERRHGPIAETVEVRSGSRNRAPARMERGTVPSAIGVGGGGPDPAIDCASASGGSAFPLIFATSQAISAETAIVECTPAKQRGVP
jgi:hypothetical protein